MKKIKITAATLLAAFVMSSCIGSFKVSNQVLDWNKSIGSKFANEVVFLAFWILPVYEVCALADLVVFNSIEFWNGGDAFAMKNGETREIEHNGLAYKITKKRNTCRIEQVGNENNYAELKYDRMNRTWHVKNDTYDADIIRFLDDNKVVVYLPNKTEKIIDVNEKGVAELRQMVSNDVPQE